jgi:hypothetical protein
MLNLNMDQLFVLSKKPALFAAGEEKFWDDPHISKSMLEAHLDPNHVRPVGDRRLLTKQFTTYSSRGY